FRNSLWLNAKKERSKITSGGRADLGGRPSQVVIVNTAKGATIKLYFDGSTKLLSKEEFSAGAGTPRSFWLSDYRPVNGVLQPHVLTLEIDGMIYEAVFDEITANPEISKTEFDFPNLSGEPLPDIPTLLQELQANEDRVENLLDSYSYLQKH